MRFAHFADVHIGAWRDQKMAPLPDQAFEEAMAVAIAERVDFIIIAGDLFNTAVPGIDHLKAAVRTLQRAKEASIPIYLIPGSHDFSPSGKSMLHVLEEAGLVVNVYKGDVVDGKLRLRVTKDQKTGCVLAGVLGRKGMLDRDHYDSLDHEWLTKLVKGEKHKVFVFHTSIEELRPRELSSMAASQASALPSGFDYYAGGHVHIASNVSLPGRPNVVYPGPVFPASFSELEKLGAGSIVIVDEGKMKEVRLELKRVVPIRLTAERATPEQVTESLLSKASAQRLEDAIVLVRVAGTIIGGSSGDIDFRRVSKACFEAGAYFVMRNTAGLTAESLGGELEKLSSAAELEQEVLASRVGKVSSPLGGREAGVAMSLLRSLSKEKAEGETNASYEDRVVAEAKRLLGLDQG